MTALCFLPLALESLDRATGEDKFQVSEPVILAVSIGSKIFMFPLGFLAFLNTSMTLGILVMNSLFVCFTPVWYRWLKGQWRLSKDP